MPEALSGAGRALDDPAIDSVCQYRLCGLARGNDAVDTCGAAFGMLPDLVGHLHPPSYLMYALGPTMGQCPILLGRVPSLLPLVPAVASGSPESGSGNGQAGHKDVRRKDFHPEGDHPGNRSEQADHLPLLEREGWKT